MQVSFLFHFIFYFLLYHYSSQHIHNPRANLILSLVNKDEIFYVARSLLRREITATVPTHLLLMFNEIRSNVFFPGGRQGAVREPLHPDTLKVAEHAHASECARATTILLVGDSSSDESHHHHHHQHSRCRRAHRTRARHPRRRRRCQVLRTLRSLNSFICRRTWRTFKVRCDVFSDSRGGLNNVASHPA